MLNLYRRLSQKYNFVNSQIFEFFVNQLLERKIKNDYAKNQFTFFPTSNNIDSSFYTYYNYFDELKKQDNNSLVANDAKLIPYDVFKWYCGYFYEKINGYLRGFSNYDDGFNNFIKDKIILIQEELIKHRLKQNLVVIRRVSSFFLKSYMLRDKRLQKDSILRDEGFLSTSLDLSYRKDKESNYRPLKKETLIFIKVPKSLNAMYLEPISKRDEYELLLPNNLSLLVEESHYLFGNRVVFAEIIL